MSNNRGNRLFRMEAKKKRGKDGTHGLLLVVLLVIVIAAHVFQLADVPTGLYADETSIGYNAARVAQAGVDEYGIRFPVYFRAFGEYKNPTYVYAVALIFRLFGISEFNLRLASAIFYIAGLILTFLLVSKVFKKSKAVEIYTIVAFGFLPVYFTLSRVSFEVISQLPWIAAANLCIWLLFYDERKGRFVVLKSIVCGLIMGTSIYTYSTARLLSFLMLVILWAVYFKRSTIKRLAVVTSTFLISLAPYAVFVLTHRGATTSRFRIISYMDDPISFGQKVHIFGRNFIEYWSPSFLVLHGDANLRHSSGPGGIIFLTIFILFLVGLFSIFRHRQELSKFTVFLAVNLLASPIAAAMTSESVPHALRSLLIGYYIFLFSCYGLAFLLSLRNYRKKTMLVGCLSVLLVFEIIIYQLHYFLIYPSKSIDAMESYDVKGSLQIAIAQDPQKILFVNNPAPTYANLEFSKLLVDNPDELAIEVTEQPVPALNSCVLYHRWDEKEIDKSPAESP